MSLDLKVEEEIFFYKLKSLNYSDRSIQSYKERLRGFHEYMNINRISDVREIGLKEAESYLLYLQNKRNGNNKENKISVNYILHQISIVNKVFEHLEEEKKILSNPFARLKRPKKEKSLPKDILNVYEVERFQEEIFKHYGLLWFCVVEVFFGTGIRLTELLNLKQEDIDLNAKLVYVKQGKGKKDRIIPIPEKTGEILKKYIKSVKQKKTERLFDISKQMIHYRFTRIKKDILKSKKTITPHGLRHTYATLLLEAGVDIRIIQILLGHSFVSSTQIYTKVNIDALISIYRKTHPRA